MRWLLAIVELLAASAAVVVVALAAIGCGVIGLALWSGWSRDRYCERKGWRNIGRF